ncbi:MAG: S-layer homology domain-containing protein, partial [Clostridia bacterium]|nr:S-layer homology domain-containing protein [Clostridia bacterium]
PRVGYTCIISILTEDPEKGSVNADSIETTGGSVHTVTATPKPGCKFIHWIDSNNNVVCETPEFTFVSKGNNTYTAVFEENKAYAALKEKLEAAMSVDYSDYSAESFKILSDVIRDAQNALTDDIAEADSQSWISALDDAINSLVPKEIVAIELVGSNEIYYSDVNNYEAILFKVIYDNETAEAVSVGECIIDNFDILVIGEQTVGVKYDGFVQDIIFDVVPVPLDFCTVSEIEDQLYKGEEIKILPEVFCALNSTALEAGKDFTVEYEFSGKTGLVTVIISGCGNYVSRIICDYNLYCEHNYVDGEYVESTCVTQGYYTEKCTICSNIVTNSLELSSEHNFNDWIVTEERGCLSDGTEIRHCSDCNVSETRTIAAIGEHKFGSWLTTTPPTELSVGIKTRICESCGAVETEEIAKLEMSNPFTDIKEDQWYTDGILWCYHSGYMAGISETDFGRKQNVTRAMFITILAKIDEADLTPYEGKSSFSDVAVGKWYSSAIEWAYQNGYTSGIAEGVFGYKNDVTREQLATFLYTYSVNKGYIITGRADLSGYGDFDRIHSWARDAVSWAVHYGLISGTSATTLAPRASATRAELALIVKNYVEGIVK